MRKEGYYEKILLFLLFLILTVQFFVVNAVNYDSYNWYPPFGNLNYSVSSQYKVSRNNNTEYHYGIDFAAPYNAQVYAAQGGRVEYAAYHSSFGNIIAVRTYNLASNSNRIIYHYAHLSQPASINNGSVAYVTNDLVTRGSRIAKVGDTGSGSDGVHLHFQIMNNNLWHQGSGDREQKLDQTINPNLFYPGVFSSPINYLPSKFIENKRFNNEILSYEKAINTIYWIDNSLINYVGLDEFNRWISSKNNSEVTVVDFMNEFEITTLEIKDVFIDNNIEMYYDLEQIEEEFTKLILS